MPVSSVGAQTVTASKFEPDAFRNIPCPADWVMVRTSGAGACDLQVTGRVADTINVFLDGGGTGSVKRTDVADLQQTFTSRATGEVVVMAWKSGSNWKLMVFEGSWTTLRLEAGETNNGVLIRELAAELTMTKRDCKVGWVLQKRADVEHTECVRDKSLIGQTGEDTTDPVDPPVDPPAPEIVMGTQEQEYHENNPECGQTIAARADRDEHDPPLVCDTPGVHRTDGTPLAETTDYYCDGDSLTNGERYEYVPDCANTVADNLNDDGYFVASLGHVGPFGKLKNCFANANSCYRSAADNKWYGYVD